MNLKENKFKDTVKIKVIGKRIYPTANVKYIGAKTEQYLTLQHHINDLSDKRNNGNALLFRLQSLLAIKYEDHFIFLFLNPV